MEILAIGLGYFVFVPLFIIAMIICAEKDSPGIALVISGIVLTILSYMWNINVFSWIAANFGLFVLSVIGYFVLGTLWSIFKFDRYCAEVAKRLKSQNYVAEYEIPRFSNSKYKITTWIVLWWASMFWYIFADLLDKVVHKIVDLFSGVYERIINRHFKDVVVTSDPQHAAPTKLKDTP